MSVINKMLRDLDRRGAPPSHDAGVAPLQSDAPPAPNAAWRPRVRTASPRPRPGMPWGLIAVGSALIAAVEFWPWRATPVAPMFPPAPPAGTAAALPNNPATATVPTDPSGNTRAQADRTAPASAPAPLAAASAPPVAAPVPPRTAPATQVQSAAPTVTVPKAPVVAPGPAPAAGSTPPPAATPNAVAAPSALASVAPSPASDPDTVGQAQALAANGGLDNALALLNEALQRATATGDSAKGPVLLREAVRLSLAEGRLQAAWALLQRHEGWLSGQADLWAQRGHVAQRLGEHRDSARAYQQALALRPSEARWQLGAAVSLAALGQTQAAAEWAERARAQGPVAPQVLDYLRQAGVPLKP